MDLDEPTMIEFDGEHNTVRNYDYDGCIEDVTVMHWTGSDEDRQAFLDRLKALFEERE